jgi:hypothetical protein
MFEVVAPETPETTVAVARVAMTADVVLPLEMFEAVCPATSEGASR